MENIEYTCIMCCDKATKKLHTSNGQEFFVLCEKERCKELLLNQLKGSNNHN